MLITNWDLTWLFCNRISNKSLLIDPGLPHYADCCGSHDGSSPQEELGAEYGKPNDFERALRKSTFLWSEGQTPT